MDFWRAKEIKTSENAQRARRKNKGRPRPRSDLGEEDGERGTCLSFLVSGLTVQPAVTVVPPHAVILQNVQHPGHLAEDQHTGPWEEKVSGRLIPANSKMRQLNMTLLQLQCSFSIGPESFSEAVLGCVL